MSVEFEQRSTEETAEVLKLLGDKTRLRTLCLLYESDCCVCELVEVFQMSQPSISQHLRKLRDRGIVIEEQRGRWMFYQLNRAHSTYPLIESIIQTLPSEKATWASLEEQGLRVNCC
ncbi:ArsR family transcriptional regulator [Salsuginibacillus halophilus]|uniref:ArsR family transcriptional regulator n=1 Tax=Salsuginibacillus halophilus TaxID=517424 RepID=A0A2P8HD10_9BACI|nr:metalloregulator ArsR/SmtB family transcription factor [Salsuginibacillus halophilus]PSL44052.1 ArsR family transcriptional regulator [Salsuginibacillus halophilus]